MTAHCSTCNGVMIPSPFRGDPPLCLWCGRSNQAQPTYVEMLERTKAKIREMVEGT